MTPTQTHQHSKPPKPTYRRGVFCLGECQAAQDFKLDAGRWLCVGCGHEHQGPDPWVRR